MKNVCFKPPLCERLDYVWGDIALSPLFGVRAGGVYPGGDTPFQNAGSYGRYWSSRAFSNTNAAYNLLFGTSVGPSGSGNRYLGYTLRCLIPTP